MFVRGVFARGVAVRRRVQVDEFGAYSLLRSASTTGTDGNGE